MPVVLGPTGSGKSELSLWLAQQLDGEIVNCDSVQIYRRFEIGTAKVPEAERRGIPHHLIDVIEPAGLFTAGDYAVAASAALRDIVGRGRTPIVVGGTGFYLRALLEGLSPGPQRDQALREKLQVREQKRLGSLHRILTRLDPAAAARIHRNDRNKTMRALEVRLVEGRPMSELFARGRASLAGFQPLRIGLSPDRELLYRRLDARTTAMFTRGLMDEVRDLLAAGVSPDAKPFESLGYAQALRAVQGLITREQAIESAQQETRRYAKRQLTWFRKERDVRWLIGFGDELGVHENALALTLTAIKSR
jgi:tRNA dimethylallyltransferase